MMWQKTRKGLTGVTLSLVTLGPIITPVAIAAVAQNTAPLESSHLPRILQSLGKDTELLPSTPNSLSHCQLSTVHCQLSQLSNPNFGPLERIWLNLISDYAFAGEYQQAFTLANRLPEAEERAMARGWIALGYGKNGQEDMAFKLAREIEDRAIRESTLGGIAVLYAEKGEDNRAFSILQGLRGSEFRNEAFFSITELLAQEKQFDRALRYLQLASDSETKRQWFFYLYFVSDRLDLALNVAQRLEDREQRGLKLADIATQLAQKGQFDQALNLARSITPTSAQNNALGRIAIYIAANGNLSQSLRLVETIPDLNLRDEVLGETAILLAQSQQFEPALALTDRLQQQENKVKTWSAIATQLYRANQQQRAEDLFNQSLKLADIVNFNQQAQAFYDIALQLAQTGQIERGINILQKLNILASDRRFKFNNFGRKLAQLGYLDAAFNLVKSQGNIETLGYIAIEYIKKGNYDQAKVVTETLNSLSVSRSNLNQQEDKLKTLGQIALAYSRAGQRELSLQTLENALNILRSL